MTAKVHTDTYLWNCPGCIASNGSAVEALDEHAAAVVALRAAIPDPISCCPRCGRRDICTTTEESSKGVVKSRKFRCQDCGPVKPGDAPETVQSILESLDRG